MANDSEQQNLELLAKASSQYGTSAPLGASIKPDGVNFSLYSREATAVELLFFDHDDSPQPSRVVSFDPQRNRTNDYWHAFVPGVRHGQLYGYRIYGPFQPEEGHRFDPSRVLLDPYGRAVVVPKIYSRDTLKEPGHHTALSMKSVVVDTRQYDWEGDVPLNRPAIRTIIYEMHVRGFTQHPSSGVALENRGTFRGLIEKIPYLQELSISAVELLPVFQFDTQDVPPGLVNYWGYQPVSFFSPHQAYSSSKTSCAPVDEFRDMVKALHRAGIEVILDVVFNHTSEGDETGPTFCFKGIANRSYYVLQQDRSKYANFSGTGNTLNANHTVVRRMIVDSLRYWVQEMHVDGFRFDLASILSRDVNGQVMSSPPVLWDIDSDPVLAGTKLIAEAWDAAGLYQVGGFFGHRWKEWNGLFRDDVRSFIRGDDRALRAFADRLVGSHDIYRHKEREAEQSVNFVTCHDGFTLNDLVSYNQKHNEANGENNRDGGNDNRSWNCGVEGPTNDPAIESLRNRQVKNFLVATVLSLGIPMFCMGDEIRRTQLGNNNAYCLDNEFNWFNWSQLKPHCDLHRFTRLLAARRALRDVTAEEQRLTLSEVLEQGEISWHGTKLNQPDWGDTSHSIALSIRTEQEHFLAHILFNAYWEALEFELPQRDGDHPLQWERWIDTSLESPNDIVPWQERVPIEGHSYRAGPRSVVVLSSKLPG